MRIGHRIRHSAPWIAAGIAALALLWIPTSMFIDSTLRRRIESGMNQSLEGYQVRLPRAHFGLLDLSVTLSQLTVRQEAHPEPPIALFPRLRASVHWSQLLRLKLVANLTLDSPNVHVNKLELEAEDSDAVPVQDRGWQAAVRHIYPLKINLLRVNDAAVTYVEADSTRPLRISHLSLTANNIRNIVSRDRTYPSPIRASAHLFDNGRVSLEGHADFLAEPTPGLKAVLELRDVPISHLRPVAAQTNLMVDGGILSAAGEIEYSQRFKLARLRSLRIADMRVDYLHTATTAAAESQRKDAVVAAAAEVSNEPGLSLRADRLELARCELGFVDQSTSPPYRVFLSEADVTITNFSNHFEQGTAMATLRGKFMGSGLTTVTAHFRPETQGPDFDLDLAVKPTPMTGLNDMLRAFGRFDVTAGDFSLYSELSVKNGRVKGYVKPLFEDLEVYDPKQDRKDGTLHKVYERIVGAVGSLLTNQSTDQVATVATLDGAVGDADASTIQVTMGLLKNAFISAILPGFDRSGPKRYRQS